MTQAGSSPSAFSSLPAPQAVEALTLLFNAVEDYAVFVMETSGIITVWHPCGERVLGYKAGEIVGKHVACLYSPEDADEAKIGRKLEAAAREGRLDEEGWRIRKNGSRFWAFTSISAMRNDAGEVWAFGKIIRDLTERRKAETLFPSVIDNADDCIITSDVRGDVLLFNRAAERTFGYHASEVVGQNVRMLMPEPHRSNHDGYLDHYLRTGEARILGIGRELTGCRKDGSTFPLQLEVSQFFLDEQRHFIGIVRDLSTKKRLEEQLRQSQKMEAVGQLAGGIAHDFNNLLTVICGNSELLMSMFAEDDPRRGMLNDVREAGSSAAALTRQLLAFSRKQVLEPKVLDLNEAVVRVEKLLRRLIGEDVRLSVALHPAVRPVRVDPNQLEQVIVNLALNARDAMPHGGRLAIEIRRAKFDPESCPPDFAPGEYAVLAISDTGIGMTPEVKSRIFEPFFTTKEPGKGTGLGLATVYGIIRQSGGHVTVQSEPGRGASFKVFLPLIREPLTPEAAPAEIDPLPRGTETILLVEDEEAVRTLAENVLRNGGYTILAAANGAEALRMAAGHDSPIQLLVTDVVMPHMGGRTVAEQVRALQPGIRVLYISGYADDAIVRHGIVRGESQFLHKPFSPRTLARKVRETLDLANEPPGLPE